MLNIRKRFFLLLTIVGLIISLASCAKKNDYIEINVFEDEKVIIVGETVELLPTVKKGDSAGTVTLVYASQNDKVATYKNGVLEGIAVGQTEIKVYCKENALAYDTVKVTVIKDKLPGMDFSSLQTTMLKGATQQIVCLFDPITAEADVELKYSSSNPAVASVDENGLLTAHAVGNTTLTIVAKNLLNVFMEETRTMEFEIVVTESDFTIDYELNGGVNAESNPVGYNVFNLPIAIAPATKVGYTFAGWYDNAEFTGNAITEIPADARANIKLYAKWDVNTYTVSYDLAGGTNADANPATYTIEDNLPLVLAEPTLKGYNFLGWYEGETKVEQLTVEALGNRSLTAKWELAQYSISYNLNGGDWALDPSSLYEYNKDRAAIAADFVIDFNKHSGKTVAADGSDFFARSWMADGSSAGYNFLVSAEYGAKWAWMLDLINEARIARGKEALKADDGQAEARGEVHNFLMGCAPGEKGGNAAYGSDYSTAEAENALWAKLLKIEIVNSYNINSEDVIIPVPVRLGYDFLGWYDENDQLVEKIAKGSTGNVKLTAKWEMATYTITYNYNGGLLSIYKYADRAAMVADFIADFNTQMGTSHTVDSFIAQGAWTVSNESVFMYRPEMLQKWGWIVDYLATTASAANKRAYEVFRNYTDQAGLQSDNSNNIYRFAYELRGFIGGFQYTKNANYKTSDYSQDDLGNGFWHLLVKPDAVTPVESYVYTDATIALGTPEKTGNEFLGWYLNGEKVESIDPKLAKDLVLEAKWSHDPIAINYVLDEGQLPEGAAQSFTYAEGLEALPTPTKLGYTFLGWYSDEACTEKVESIAKGLLEEVTLYASWELTVFHITYELNGGAFIRDEIVDLYDSFDAMTAEFIADYSALTGVTGITAANFYGKTVKYGLYSFFKNEEMAAKWNWLLEYVQAYAEEVGYTGKAYLNVSAGAANFNKYARPNFAALLQKVMLNNVSPISMNFEEVDGEAFWTACPDKTIQVGTESVNEYTIDQLPVKLANPDKKGATFVGWYTNADLKNGEVTEITIDLIGDITLYARWSDSVISFDTYTITYELDGGQLVEGAATSYVEETGVLLDKGATKTGYAFVGWFLDAACTEEVKEFTALDKGNKTVYACWEVVDYDITYNAGEGTLPTMMVPEGDYTDWAALVADFAADFKAHTGKIIAADGSDFFARSWMADGSSAGYNFLTSAEYGAKWGGLLTVINETRVAQGKAELTKDDGQAEARGEVQNLLTKSSADAGVTSGYGSDYTSEEVWGKVWDHFEMIHMVEIQVPTTYNVEQLPYTLATPTAPANKDFAGWYTNAELTGEAMFELPVGTIGNIELWAKYVDAIYDITYELNEGVLPEGAPVQFTSAEEVTLVAPTRFGYDFLGWELNGEVVTKIAAGTKTDVTLVATWAPTKYDIEYVLNEGVLPEGAPTQFEHDGEVVLPTPTREGYVFLGWILDNKYIETLENKDYVLEAKWKKADQTGYEIIYDLNGGNWGITLDDFAEELVADFNNVTISGAVVTNRENFGGTTHPNIKDVFAKPEMLAKYKWFNEFILAEYKAYNAPSTDYYDEVVDLITRMINQDTEAIGGSYANARTIWRHFVQGLITSGQSTHAWKSLYKDYSVDGAYDAWNEAINPVQFTVEPNEALRVPYKDNYVFVGWFVDGIKVEFATGDDVLVAEWLHEDYVEHTVEFELDGGIFAESDYETFVKGLIADFNNVTISGAVVTNRENFGGTTHPNIKDVFAKAEMLEKYKWFNEFILAEYTAYNDENSDYYDEVVEMITKMINQDTTAIGGNYANARTIWRHFVQGLITRGQSTHAWKTLYKDYSSDEAFAPFAAALEARVSKVYRPIDELPTPEKEGHLFLGWYIGEEKVESVKANCTLTAKWVDTSTLKYTISYNANEGTLPEGAVVEFVYNQTVVLPVPTREGYKFLGWYEGETLVETVTNKNYELVAKWEAITAKSITYVLDGGILPEDAPKDYLLGVGVATLPTPTRSGYEFKGWFTDEACTEAITSIGADANEDIKLFASWEKLDLPTKELKVDANDANAYATYEEAEAAALDGDTIIIAAGNYSTITITKSVKVYGANHGVNPNQAERGEETVFTGNVVIAANDVTVDGIKITGDGRIKGSANGVANPVITNLVIQDSTTNPTSGDSATAPLEFYTYLEGAVFENITISNVKQTDTTNGRPMLLFAAQVDGITIKNSNFVVSRKNYNDAIKFQTGDSDAHEAAWGIKGDLVISGCHFENFAQYVIWVSDYQEGTYEFVNNTFKNNGQTAGSHCAVRMGVYSGEAAGLTPCNFSYNTVDNSYSLFRADTNENRTATTQVLTINYNKLLNCKADSWVDNRNAYPADATNNYYGTAPIASSFKNANYDPYYANEDDVPAYVDKDNSYKINYELNGGLVENAPEYYSSETGLAKLPVPTKENHVFMGWTLNGTAIEAIEIGHTGEVTLVAQWREDALYVGEGDADYIYATLAAALEAAEAGDKIILMAGEYDEAVTVNKADITIAGPNQGVNAVNGTRAAEAIIKNVISVDPAATGLMIDGLAFTAGGRVVATATSATYDGFTFQNNKVYDTNESTTPWVVNRYVMDAVVEFRLKSGGKNKNFEFYNNSFINCPSVNIMVNRPHNLTVDGNLFKDFSQDAFRIAGGYTNGLHAFTNNVFEVENKGDAHNGIFFYSLSGGDELAVVVLQNNVFRNLGMADASKFTGALSANFYQEKGLKWDISYNIFENCYNYMWLRNNGASASNWSSKIENNQFLGLPTDFYYGTYTGSDTETTNPHLNVFGANYYEDNDGNVITNMDDIKHLFFHTATIGTALSAKPGEQEVNRYEFFTISYELNGGSTRDSFVYNYSTANTDPITLPTLTKANHQFNGWLLNGELVTEIPATARGNLELVADFTVLEGEIYEITFVANKENAIWPSRGAYDRFEIYDALWADLYEWAQLNGETASFEDYKTATQATIDAYSDIKLRNTELGNYADDTGSTEYFLNTPKYFQKWSEFFVIFRDAMLAVNSNQNFYTDTYATMVRLSQFLNWTTTGEGYFSGYLAQMCAAAKIPQEIPADYRGGQIVQLPQISLENGLEFLGWYDNAEFTGEAITAIQSTDTGAKTFYGKWAEEVKATEVEINKVTELLLFKEHQLVWTINPENTTDKSVDFFSSNEAVATINTKGLITTVGLGTTTITMRVYGNRELDVVFDLTVYVEDYIDGSYATNSYVEKEDSIQLNATVFYKNNTDGIVNWSSLNPEIATVDANGVVAGLKAGTATIVATDPNNDTLTLEFVVTVLDAMPTGILDLALRANENNIYTTYDMIVGGAYSTDILGSVSKLLANSKLVRDTKYYDKANTTSATYGTMESIEFVTVHYTGNMSNGADAAANANYFANSSSVSIHYTTGNDGVFYCLDESKGAWHAGDSAALNIVGKFQWHATGVKVGANDPKWPEWTISDDFYYEINGQKTSIKMPSPWNYSSRNTDHILNADGTISSQPDFGQTGFQNREPESFINKIGLPFTIKDGEYYMGTTWWAYSQVYEGRIVSTGGNRNSIGIESCVDINSDLWWTWQKTAQLVADILVRNNLDVTRVGGHHFFDGKNCPQPMLENNCEIWWHFISLIEAEYELLTEYEGYEVSITSDSDLVDDYGRIIKQPDETTCVTYTITFTKGDDTQSITLSSMIKGLYVGRDTQ